MMSLSLNVADCMLPHCLLPVPTVCTDQPSLYIHPIYSTDSSAGSLSNDAPTAAPAMKPSKLPSSSLEPKKKARKDSSAKLTAMFSAPADDDDIPPSVDLPPLGPAFRPCTLPELQSRLRSLRNELPEEVPAIPAHDDDTDSHAPIKQFASQLQVVIEQFNLLLSLVSSATYKWGVDRSGASQQNLGVMVSELQQCQEMISSGVSGRLSNVLCPAVDVLVGEVEIQREGAGSIGDNNDDAMSEEPSKKRKLNNNDNNNSSAAPSIQQHNLPIRERRINHYIRAQVDPSYVHLSHVILARNAEMIRHTVATSIFTAEKVISDYLKAMKKDVGHSSFNL